MRCKQPFKKSVSRACRPTLRSSWAVMRLFPAAFAFTGKGVAGSLAKFPPPTVQQVGIDLKGPADRSGRGALLQLLQRRQLELLRESPSRQTHHSSSVQWNLSLNSLSHFWGQLHPVPAQKSQGGYPQIAVSKATGPFSPRGFSCWFAFDTALRFPNS